MKGSCVDSRKTKGPMGYHTMTGAGVKGKENLRSVVSIFGTRDRCFRFEFKSFKFQIENGGTLVRIIEQTRNQNFVVSIDFGGGFWLVNNLRKAKEQFSKGSFFTKYQTSYALFLLQRFDNQNSSFISLSKIQQSIVKSVVVFPAGQEGEGWLGIAGELHLLLFDPPKRKLGLDQRKSEWNRGATRKVTGIEREGEPLTYAEAVAVKHKASKVKDINNEQIVNSKEGVRVRNIIMRGKGIFVEGVRRGVVDRGDKVKQGQNTSKLYHKEKKQFKMDDWSKTVVCTRESLWHDWSSIQNCINKLLGTEYVLFPFLPDKATFHCCTSKEAEELGKDRAWFSTRSTAIVLKKWHPPEVFLDKKVAFTGGWIEVENLPLSLWRTEVFLKIGELCGGFEELDRATENKQRLFAPRIKVRGNRSGFIPAEIDLTDEEENMFTIRLKSRSRLDFKNKCNMKTLWPEEGAFCRCVIRIGGNRIIKKIFEIEGSSEELELVSSYGKASGGEEGVREEDFTLNDELFRGGSSGSRGENKEEIKNWDKKRSLLVDGNSVNIEHEEGENKFLVNVPRIFATLKKGLIEGTGQVQVNGSDIPKVINRGDNVEINGVGPKMIKPCGLAERPVLDNCSGFSSRKLIKEKWKVHKTLKVYKKKKVKKSKVVIGEADIIETETEVVITPPFDRLGEGTKIQNARKEGGVEEEINSIIDGGDISYDDNPETDTILSDTDFSFSDDDEEEMRGKEYGKSVIDLVENGGWSEFLFRGGELSFSKAVNKKLFSVVGSRIELDLEGFKLNFLITAFIPVRSVLFFVGKDSSFPADGGGLKVAAISSFIDQENKEKSVVSDPIFPYSVSEVESEAMAVEKNSVPMIDYEQQNYKGSKKRIRDTIRKR
ncbi:hypothetical protein LguiA_000885 [Lonicera macranthoides]